MIPSLATEPPYWLVIFHRRSTWWVERLTPGRFKHVSLAGFVPDARAWVHLSWEMARLRVEIVADDAFDAWMVQRVADGGLLRMPAPSFDVGRWRMRPLTCCGMALHVLGLRGSALRPNGLWRLLVANGADIVTHGEPLQAEDRGVAADCERAGVGSGCAARPA